MGFRFSIRVWTFFSMAFCFLGQPFFFLLGRRDRLVGEVRERGLGSWSVFGGIISRGGEREEEEIPDFGIADLSSSSSPSWSTIIGSSP